MTPTQPKEEWIEKFVRHVGDLELNVDASRVWRDAEAIYETAGDMPPEEAADIWIEMPQPDPLAEPEADDDAGSVVSDA